VRGLAGVVADERTGLICERTYDGNPFDSRFERKQAIVFEQDHGLVGELAGEGAVFCAVEFLGSILE